MLMTEEIDWENLTPHSLINAVAHVRERFEEEEFKFNFLTRQECYKELHPVPATETAPAVFKHYMDVLEEGLKQAVKKGFDDLFEIGLANANLITEGPIEWAKSHLALLITGKEYKIEIWIKNVCDQQEMSKGATPEDMEEFVHWRTWRAPKLIIMQPSGNMLYDPAVAWSREAEDRTEKLLHGLSKRFVQGLGFHLDRIAGEAHIKLAKQGKQLPRPARELSVKTKRAERRPDPNNPTPVAFISYSWDSDAHKLWVLDLATTLQAHGGVQIVLDCWHLPPGDDRTIFMEKSIGNSKFVVLVCTPDYAARANYREGGVGYEATIITAELAENINQRKFIPVLREGDWKSSLPVWIKNRVGLDLRNNPYSEDEYQKLLRALHDAPLKPPPVGPKPVFEDASVRQKFQPPSKPAPVRAKPLIVPLRYGRSPLLGKHSMGHHGLIVANHGEPAYDVSVLTSEVRVGPSKLKLDGSKSTLTKADGDAFFEASIERSPGSWILGSGLFDEMRNYQIDSITVALVYKDAENRWYKTICEIERNVNEIGGLSVKYVRQEPTNQP
jgi:TIR domain-containing protein